MKLNWGLSIGIVYTLFALVMILFAVKASNQKYDLVTENYYDDAVNYQKKIDAGRNAANSDTKLNLEYSKENNQLIITTGGKEISMSGTISFYKPDKAADDFKLNFLTDNTGKQSIALGKLAHGYWNVSASWTMDGKDCFEEKRIYIP
jgi:nitrogen fixation protein FixH